MYALHALWRADGRLAVWAEDAAVYRGDAYRPGDRAGRGGTAHPFACPAGEVARLLGTVGPGLGWLAEQAGERWTGLLLPSLGGRPVPSPDLPVGAGPRGVGLSPWRVPALLFDRSQAAQLLGALHDPHWPGATVQLPDGTPAELAYGASVRWLAAVHDLAWRLVGRGRLLPVPVEEAGEWYARWRPAPDAPARRESAALVAGCPPVCRAEHPAAASADPAGTPAPPTAAALFTGVLDALADQEARVALADLDPPAEPFLAALYSPDARLGQAPPAGLSERLAVWQTARPADGPLRLDFRLTEPLGHDADPAVVGPDTGTTGDDADSWRLDLLVRAVDRPSLVVPAASLRPGARDPAREALVDAVPAGAGDPVEAFHEELARAVRVAPELRALFTGSFPTEARLGRAGALRFLREDAPALTAAGFAVLLPAWWQRRPRLGLVLTAAAPADGPAAVRRTAQVDRDAVLAFEWRLALGDLTLTERELADLAAAQQGLVRLRGRWVEVDPDQLAVAVRFLAEHGTGTMAPVELLRLALDDGAVVDGLPVTEVRAAGPLGDLLAGRPGPADRVPELPEGFTGTLRPYQRRGLAWLDALGRLGLGAVLADDMGLGKTVQTLALLALERERGAVGPVLLVCPMSLVGNWRREAAAFAPGLRVHVHHGPDRTAPAPVAFAPAAPGTGTGLDPAADPTGPADPAGLPDLVITTYGVVQRDAAELRRIHWRRIVADEAQHIKNRSARQSRALRSLRSGPRIALTGTPVENRLADLHAVLDFANPGLFGSPESFRERFANPVEQTGSVDAAARLRRVTGPFLLRRRKSDPQIVRDLPAKQEFTVSCSLTAEQAGLYRAVVTDLLERLGGLRGVERKGAVLAAIGRLKQVCNHPAQLLHDGTAVAGRSGKVERLVELLMEALAEGDRALVFTQYAEFGAMLRPYLRRKLGEEVLYLHGGVPRARRDAMVERFQSPDGPRVFLLSLRAGGTGLNLTAANQVVHLDRWWNPAVEDQATDRAHRIGQRRDVQVRRLVCAGTVEERIDELLTAKRTLAEAALGADEQWLAELPAERLRELLTLSADSIGA